MEISKSTCDALSLSSRKSLAPVAGRSPTIAYPQWRLVEFLDHERMGGLPRRRRLRALLLETAASIAILCCVDSRAYAQQCAPANPGEGGTVTCSGGFIGSGFTAPINTGVTVNVESGTTLGGTVRIEGTGNSTINNLGTLQGSTAVQFIGVAGYTKILNNDGALNGGIAGSGDGAIVINQRGALNQGGIAITGNGQNTLNVAAGKSVNGLANLVGATNVIDNSGTFNAGLILNGTTSNQVTNRAGAQVSGELNVTGPSNTIDNHGTFNGGLVLTGDGVNRITDFSDGTIQTIVSNGTARDFVDNIGKINVSVVLGDGDDTFINRALARSGPDLASPIEPVLIVSGTVNTGSGQDRFEMLGGTVNGTVLLGAGNDEALIAGGTITNTVQAQEGNDHLVWTGGEIIGLDMGPDTDFAEFIGLTPANLKVGLPVNGGLGVADRLLWTNTSGGDVTRYTNWEQFQLAENSQLTFENYYTLTLGDSGTGTGALSIDATSTVFAGNGTHTVASFGAGQLVDVTNAGVIDLTNNNSNATDKFVIAGSYTGQSGRLSLQTVLASDNSPSDQLAIKGSGAAGTGSTSIFVTNLNGPGDMTVADGIRVVDADGGAITTAGAFSLGGPVAAGVFEYQLFRGGVTPNAGNDNDWFLRSSNLTSPPVSPPPVSPPPVSPPPVSPPPVSPPPVSPPPGLPPPPAPPPPDLTGGPDPLIRPEIPSYAVAPALAREIGLATLGTFHKRQGDQALLNSYGMVPGAWGSLFGQSNDQQWKTTIAGLNFNLAPEFDGNIWGLQAGLDLLGRDHGDGSQDRLGLFYSYGQGTGDLIGHTLGRRENPSGSLNIHGNGLGAYWTHIGPTGWYLDTVAIYTWFGGEATSDRGIGIDVGGGAFAASVEGGYPVHLGNGWTIEPQAQLIWQRVDLDDTRDRFSTIDYGATDGFTGRLGARLEANTVVNGIPLQPFVDVNLWHSFDATSPVVFNERAVVTDLGGTALEVGGGISAQLSKFVSLYGAASFATDLEGGDHQSYGGNIGLRIRW